MKTLVECYLPIYASASFEIEKPIGWDRWSKPKKIDYFLEHGETRARLCHSCSNLIESDEEMNIEYVGNKSNHKFIEFYERKK